MKATLFLSLTLMATTPQVVAAQNFATCTKVERGQFLAAADRAERLALTATSAIGPNPVFDRWFGGYNAKSGEIVRKNLKSMVRALQSGEITAACKNNGQGLCAPDTYAFVNRDTPFVVNLCPNFFTMDTMKQLTEETAVTGNGTRAGTIIHEISHFTDVSGTEDHCYSRTECTRMAENLPLDALLNADSYQYFVEDVTFFGMRGEPESVE